MLMMNIIMAVCLLPILPILYFYMRNYAKPMKLIILGVTLPQSVHEDPGVLTIVNTFKKKLDFATLPLILFMFAPFFMNSMGAAITWYMVWFTVAIIVPLAIYAVHREKLMTLKRENNWYGEAAGKTLADIQAAAVPANKINGIWFFIPVALSLFPVVYTLSTGVDPAVATLYITFAATTVLFWPLYYIIFRMRSELVNENMTLTMALTRVRRYNWGKFWLLATWSTGVLTFLLWLFENKPMAVLYLTLVYTVVVLIIAVKTEFTTRKAQQKLTSGSVTEIGDPYIDEDEYWIWGYFYNNPNDRHFMVNYRVGMGMSVNLAYLGGKILMAFAALCIVAMPFMGIWLWIEESTPVKLTVSDSVLTASHTRDMYKIPINTIESVELVERSADLPYIIARTNGTSFENLNKGRFSVLDYGSTFLSVHIKDPPFIIVVAGGQAYILNDADSMATRAVYEYISKTVKTGGR